MNPSDGHARRSPSIFYFALVGLFAAIIWALVIPNFRRPMENRNRNSCINNLRMIDSAKQTWGLENGKGPGDVPTWADILPYLGMRDEIKEAPKCPQGGVLSLGPLSNHPTCTFPGHVLP